ncbi:MAG: hypothetical protein LBJ96_05775, partial [Holosporaceae bacterium]|nr:hypothetical protein [Holosporaceae bacterium]
MKKIIKSAVVLCFASALFGDVKSMHPDFDVESQQLMADLEEWQREFDQICDLLARPLGTQPEVTDEEYAKFSEDIANEDADEAYAAILDPNEVCKWISDSDRLDFISDPHYNREIGKLWADLFVSDPSSAVALELRKSIAKNLREYSQLENQRIEEVKDILKQNYAILGGGFEGEMSVTVGNNAYRISVDRLFSRLYDTDDYNHIENK